MSFSTDSRLPSTWPIEKLNLDLVANLFGCSQSDARAHRDRFAAYHADDAWLDRKLAELSVPSLCVAAALAGHGGMLHLPVLDMHANSFGLERGEIDAGVHDLIQLLLVAPLQSPRGRCLALVASAADRLATRVTGLQLAPLPREAFVADPRADGGRALIAAAMALGTAELRLTNAGALHRTGIKKLAKQLDHDADRLEHLIYAALELGLIRVGEDDLLSPVRDHLLAAAEGRYPHLSGLETLAALMSDGAPVAIDAVESYTEASMYLGPSAVRADLLGLLPGFTAGTANGRAALVAVAPAGSSAASVTPSFEVFVPPESHPRDLIGMLGACELLRIDRAIVARITKASVVRAVGRGATGDQIVEAFATGTRTPIPQNVAAAIRDWAGSSISATVDRGTVVVVPASEQVRVLAALPRARAVAPGVLVVPEEVTTRAVTSALRKLGILERSPEPAAPPPPTRASVRPSPVPATATVLRARLAAYQRNDPHERRLVKHAVREPAVEAATSDLEAIVHRLERWESLHSELLPLDGFDALVALLEQVSTVDRQFLLAARGRRDLSSRLNALLARPGLGALDPDLLLDLETVFDATRPRSDSGAALAWHRDHLFARLEAAARTHSTVVLDLGARTVTMAVNRIAPKGSTLLVFGEDEHDVNHAIRLDHVRALADAPASPASAVSNTARWRPAEGMKPPAGHVRCPCDSGRRYRDCCRGTDAPS